MPSLPLDVRASARTADSVPARDAEGRVGEYGRREMHSMALRAPMIVKMLGAQLLSLAVIGLFLFVAPPGGWSAGAITAVVFGASGAFLLLVFVALLPLRDLEATASRVWRGDFGARVSHSAVADRDFKRIGTTFNVLLNGLMADHSRMHALATAVIDAGDRERAALGRELHDSTAQQLAALKLQLSAAARDSNDPLLAERLEQVQQLAGEVLEEVRLLAHTVHPRVLDDLGLAAALQKLTREAAAASGVDMTVTADAPSESVPPAPAAVLYRIAQAAVHNVIKHARARRVDVRLGIGRTQATLEVIDDGCGFDVVDAERRRPGMGLFTMRERAALVGGRFEVVTELGAGTRVVAIVPLTDRPSLVNERASR